MANEEFIKKEYKLNTNPFYDVSYGPILVDRVEVKTELYEKIKSFINVEPTPQMMFLTGAYGLGKTFTLLEIEKEIRNKKAMKDENILCCYIRMVPTKVPSDYLLYIFHEILNALGSERVEEIFTLSQKITDSVQKQNSLTDNIARNFKSLFSLIKTESHSTVYNYLLGDKLPKSKTLSIDKSPVIDSGDIAKLYLMDFLKLMEIVGYKALVVLIDEFENLFTLSGKKKTAEVLTTFREIYDEVNKQVHENVKLSNSVFVFASASSTQEDVLRLIHESGSGGLQAFVDRLRTDGINLPPFERKYVRELIQIKLNKYRNPPSTESDIFPFKEDFIDYIHHITGGNPRYILQYTAAIIDNASEKGYKTIGEKEAQDIVSEKNLG